MVINNLEAQARDNVNGAYHVAPGSAVVRIKYRKSANGVDDIYSYHYTKNGNTSVVDRDFIISKL